MTFSQSKKPVKLRGIGESNRYFPMVPAYKDEIGDLLSSFFGVNIEAEMSKYYEGRML